MHAWTLLCIIGNLKNALKELYPLAKNWYNIGVFLNIEDHILDKIASDVDGVDNQLRKMLSEWFKQVNQSPSWDDLADAIEIINSNKAKILKCTQAG